MSHSYEPVSDEDVKEALATFEVHLSRDVIAKLKLKCLMYCINAEQLAEIWMCFKAKEPKAAANVTDGVLDLFEKNFLTKEYLKEHDVVADSKQLFEDRMAEPADNQPVALKDELMSEDEDPVIESKDPVIKMDQTTEESHVEEQTQVVLKPEQIANSGDDDMVETILDPNECLTQEELNVLNRKTVVASLCNDNLEESDFKGESRIKISIEPIDKRRHISQSDHKICTFNPYDMLCVFEDRLKRAADFYSELLNNNCITNLAVDLPNDDDCFVCFVRKEANRIRFNEEAMIVEGSGDNYRKEDMIKHLRVDLSELKTYSFFPGQIILFRGHRAQGKMKIAEILNPLPFVDCKLSTLSPVPGSPMQIVIVAGPFSDNEKKNMLIRYVNDAKPHVIILIGPFIDGRDEHLVTSSDEDMETISKNFFNKLISCCNDTRLIIVPSSNDVFSSFTVPTPPLEIPADQNVISYPNPCQFTVNGLKFAATSTDIVKHVMKQEFSSGLSEGRMKRIVSHILYQRNMYPLFPVDGEANVDYKYHQFMRLSCKPDFLILPSDLKSFVFNVDDCICINPDRISKSTLCRIRITSTSPDNHFKFDVQVFKLT